MFSFFHNLIRTGFFILGRPRTCDWRAVRGGHGADSAGGGEHDRPLLRPHHARAQDSAQGTECTGGGASCQIA